MKVVNKDKLVDFLNNYQISKDTTVMDLYRDILRELPNMTIEAITIEYLEKYQCEKEDWGNTYEVIEDLIKNWENVNDEERSNK